MKLLARLALLICLGVFLSTIRIDSRKLPERIASHFDGQGDANGWMSRSAFTTSMRAVGIGIPALIVGVTFSARFLPPKFLNLPPPSYWRKPKNFRRACAFLFHSSLWFACAFLLWQSAFSHLIAQANQISPPHLNNTHVAILTIALLIVTLAWFFVLTIYFVKTSPSRSNRADDDIP